MFATIRQTRADERNLFQVESEESGILYRAETPWSGLNLPFDAENLRKLVFTDDGGKEMFHTEYDIVRNTVNSLLKYRYLAGKSVRLSEYRVTGSDGAELGAFYTRIDGALTSQMVISFGGRLYDCYHYALGRIYVISIFDRGRQIAQITKPLDTWNQLDVYYLHLIDSCRDMLPVLSFFTVWVDAARFDGAGRFARYSYQKSRVRTFNRNNDKYDPDWIAKIFGNEAAEQLDFLLETHPEKDSPGARIPEKAARRLKMIIAAVIFAVLLTAAVLLFFFLHPQEALLPGEFSSQMREMGYTVSETSGQYGTDGAAETYEAVRDSCRVEYISAASEEDAEEFFSGIRSAWEQESGTPGSSTASSGLHGETYARTSDGEYRAVSRIGNTVVTGSSPEADREEIKKVMQELGY